MYEVASRSVSILLSFLSRGSVGMRSLRCAKAPLTLTLFRPPAVTTTGACFIITPSASSVFVITDNDSDDTMSCWCKNGGSNFWVASRSEQTEATSSARQVRATHFRVAASGGDFQLDSWSQRVRPCCPGQAVLLLRTGNRSLRLRHRLRVSLPRRARPRVPVNGYRCEPGALQPLKLMLVLILHRRPACLLWRRACRSWR